MDKRKCFLVIPLGYKMVRNKQGKSFLIFFLLCLLSCSILSKNMFKEGKISFYGGRFSNKSWTEKLIFKRFSWFQELSLVFDFTWTELERKSKFFNWISNEEIEKISSCNKIYVSFFYSSDEKEDLEKIFFDQLKFQYLSEVKLEGFEENIKMHPNYNGLSLKFYKFKSFCLKVSEKPQIFVNMPGFNKVRLD